MKILLTSDTHYGFSGMMTTTILQDFVEEIKQENVDIILHAGDWGSSNQSQVESCMKLFRDSFPLMPIVSTNSNHDVWDSENAFKTIYSIKENFRILKGKYSILSHWEMDNVEVFTYDSWYKTNTPPSNDAYYMPVLPFKKPAEMHQYLMEQSYMECKDVCEQLRKSTAKHKIVVTHFEPIGNYRDDERYDGMLGSYVEYEKLNEAGATLLCYGHSHRKNDLINKYNVRVVNAGSDYNYPCYKIIELETVTP